MLLPNWRKKGNKWIALKTLNYSEFTKQNELIDIPDLQWCSLSWTCIPKVSELRNCVFSINNPIEIPLKF